MKKRSLQIHPTSLSLGSLMGKIRMMRVGKTAQQVRRVLAADSDNLSSNPQQNSHGRGRGLVPTRCPLTSTMHSAAQAPPINKYKWERCCLLRSVPGRSRRGLLFLNTCTWHTDMRSRAMQVCSVDHTSSLPLPKASAGRVPWIHPRL